MPEKCCSPGESVSDVFLAALSLEGNPVKSCTAARNIGNTPSMLLFKTNLGEYTTEACLMPTGLQESAVPSTRKLATLVVRSF